jgi:hypothetical protein
MMCCDDLMGWKVQPEELPYSRLPTAESIVATSLSSLVTHLSSQTTITWYPHRPLATPYHYMYRESSLDGLVVQFRRLWYGVLPECTESPSSIKGSTHLSCVGCF